LTCGKQPVSPISAAVTTAAARSLLRTVQA
jgi:hypothetical protein